MERHLSTVPGARLEVHLAHLPPLCSGGRCRRRCRPAGAARSGRRQAGRTSGHARRGTPTYSQGTSHRRTWEVIRSHQESSGVINSHQESSRVIRSHQESSGVIRSHHEPSAYVCTVQSTPRRNSAAGARSSSDAGVKADVGVNPRSSNGRGTGGSQACAP